jgi:hypothetical protein
VSKATRTMWHGAMIVRHGRAFVRAREASTGFVVVDLLGMAGPLVMPIVLMMPIVLVMLGVLVMPIVLVMLGVLMRLGALVRPARGALLVPHRRGMVLRMIRLGLVGRVVVRGASDDLGGAVMVVPELAVPRDVQAGPHLHAQHPHQHRDHREGRVP